MGEWQKLYEQALKKAKHDDAKTRADIERKQNNQKALKTAAEQAQEKTKSSKNMAGGKNKASGTGSTVVSDRRTDKGALTNGQLNAFEKTQSQYAVPKAIRNAAESYIDNSITGTAYNMLTGNKLLDEKRAENPYNEQLHSGVSAGVGQLVGQTAQFMQQSALAQPLTGKAAIALTKTKLGQAVAKRLGEGAVVGVAENLIDAGTVGLAQNAAMAYGEGLRGQELAKDVAINTGLEMGLGAGLELAGKGIGKLANKVNEKQLNAALPVKAEPEPLTKMPFDVEPEEDILFSQPKVDLPVETAPTRTMQDALNEPVVAETPKVDKLPSKPKKTKNKAKSVSADAKNPDLEMTYEQAVEKMDTYEHKTPKKMPGKGDVSKAADTVLGSNVLGKELTSMVQDELASGTYTKVTKSNKVTLDNVYADLEKNGLESSTGAFLEKLKSGKEITEEDIGMGLALVQELDKKGDYDKALDVVGDVIEMMSQAGRTLQAAQLFTKATPYGRVRLMRKTADKMSKQFGREITLDEKLLKQLFEAKDEKTLTKIKRELMMDVWNQVPSTLMEKLDAIRYTAMLSSPKTHLRNIFGNGFMAIGKSLSDGVEAALEKTVFEKKMDKLGAIRNKSFVNPLLKEDRELLAEADKIFNDVADTVLNNEVKYFESGNMHRPQDSKVFKGKNPVSKTLEKSRELVSGSLEKEDKAFMKLNFKSAFAQICKANGLSVADLTAKEKAYFTQYAIEQAQIATFRDRNALAEAMNKVYNMTKTKATDSKGMKVAKTAGKVALDATLPFRRTPANVLKQGFRYSPGGVLEGMVRIASAKDADSLMKGIDSLSNGIVGTPVLLAGLYMAKQGLANGSLGLYSDKETKYEKTLGKQDYAIMLGDKSITMDWMSPYSMPFFVGVEMGTALMDKELSGYELVDALASITDPFFEMSMLQGLETLMTTNYEDKSVQTLVQNVLKSYVTQFVPAISQQIAKTVAKTTTSPSTKGIDTSSGKFVQSTLNTLQSKVPGLYSRNAESVDVWGRTETKETTWDYVQAGFRNIISPANIKDMNVTKIDEEILRVYDQLDEELARTVVPSVPTGNITHNDVKYEVTGEDYVKYLKNAGDYKYKGVQSLIKSDKYKKASAEKKAEMIANIYKEGNEYAKAKYLEKKLGKTEYQFTTLSDKRQANYDSKKVSKDVYVDYFKTASTDDKANITQDEARAKLNSMSGLSYAQKQYLWSQTNSGWKTSY